MRKKMLLGAFLIIAAMASAAEMELKVGADIYRDLTEDASGNNPTKIHPGGSAGMELLVNEDSPFRFGVGGEWKSAVTGKDGFDAHQAIPVYGVGKLDISETMYLVGRFGYAFTAGDADDVEDTNGGLYGGIGIGKEFMDERFNIELMYEAMEYDYDTIYSTNEDGMYHNVALKFGIKFGGPAPAPMVVIEEKPVEVVKEVIVEKPVEVIKEVIVEKPVEVIKEVIVEKPVPYAVIPPEGLKLREQFRTDKFELNNEAKEEIARISGVLKGHKGTLEIAGHTDSIGAAKYNMGLSQRRAEAVVNEFKANLEGEEIGIEAKWYGEEKPMTSNDTVEGRAENRRVEVFWMPEEAPTTEME